MGSKRGRAERCQSKKDLLTLTMEEGAKERGWPLEARFSLGASKWNAAMPTPDFWPSEIHLDF